MARRPVAAEEGAVEAEVIVDAEAQAVADVPSTNIVKRERRAVSSSNVSL